MAGDLMVTSVVVVHRKVGSGGVWLSVPPDWPFHTVLYGVDVSVRWNRLTTPGHSSKYVERPIILYPDLWLTVHRNSVWIRKTN